METKSEGRRFADALNYTTYIRNTGETTRPLSADILGDVAAMACVAAASGDDLDEAVRLSRAVLDSWWKTQEAIYDDIAGLIDKLESNIKDSEPS